MKTILKIIIFFILGLMSPFIMVLIRMKIFNPYLLLIIAIPLWIYLRIYNHKKRKDNKLKQNNK